MPNNFSDNFRAVLAKTQIFEGKEKMSRTVAFGRDVLNAPDVDIEGKTQVSRTSKVPLHFSLISKLQDKFSCAITIFNSKSTIV